MYKVIFNTKGRKSQKKKTLEDTFFLGSQDDRWYTIHFRYTSTPHYSIITSYLKFMPL